MQEQLRRCFFMLPYVPDNYADALQNCAFHSEKRHFVKYTLRCLVKIIHFGAPVLNVI